MKYKLPLFLVFALPMLSTAQLVVKNAEDFKIGTVLEFQLCDTSGVMPGTGGTNQTWDFSSLKLLPDKSTEWMVLPSSTPYADKFPGATLVEKYSNGSYVYVDMKQGQSNLLGFANPNMMIAYPKPVVFAKRPPPYGFTFSNPFTDNFTAGGMDFSGSGVVTIEADGYGRLILPNKTYKNVLRIKIVQVQTDTIKQYNSASQMRIVTYVWFDGVNTSAVFKISYTKSMGYNTGEVGYLLSEEDK